MEVLLRELLEDKMKHLAFELGMLLVDSKDGLLVCNADGTDCMKLEEWGMSILALYKHNEIIDIIKENYMKYAIQQTDSKSCWAAAMTTVVAINRSTRIEYDHIILRYIARGIIPISIRSQVINDPPFTNLFSEEELQNVKSLPEDDYLDSWLAYYAKLAPATLEYVVKKYIGEQNYGNTLLCIRMTAQLLYPEIFQQQNLYSGLMRIETQERIMFGMMNFYYERVSIKDFCSVKLQDLLKNGPLIMALHYSTLVDDNVLLDNKLSQLEENAAKGYESHFIVVANYYEILNEVWVINTLPYEKINGAINPLHYSFSASPPLFHRIPFNDFSKMVISDVRCVSKFNHSQNATGDSGTAATSIPVAYMKPGSYTPDELQKIFSFNETD
ncbi:MAG: hypothetical protein HUJ66_05985 [Oscillospiraceae bacterium]|nr:hypothetical protein [Oscillospiraceae bacterium]